MYHMSTLYSYCFPMLNFFKTVSNVYIAFILFYLCKTFSLHAFARFIIWHLKMEDPSRASSNKCQLKGLYVVTVCLTAAFAVTFILVFTQLTELRSNLDHLQTLEMIEQSSFGRAQVDQKKSDDALDRNKRGAVAYFSVRDTD